MEKLHASSDSHRHGLLAKCVLLDHENPETFALLHQQYIDRINPSDGIEITLVEDLAATTWRQRRLWRIERNLLSEAMQKRPESAGNRLTGAFSDLSRGPELTLLDRQESRLHRSFHRTLKNIQLLRQIELPNEPRTDELDLESAIYPTTSEEQTAPESQIAANQQPASQTQIADAQCGAHASCAVFTPGEHLPPQHKKLPNEPKSPEPIANSIPYPQTSPKPPNRPSRPSIPPTNPAIPNPRHHPNPHQQISSGFIRRHHQHQTNQPGIHHSHNIQPAPKPPQTPNGFTSPPRPSQ